MSKYFLKVTFADWRTDWNILNHKLRTRQVQLIFMKNTGTVSVGFLGTDSIWLLIGMLLLKIPIYVISLSQNNIYPHDTSSSSTILNLHSEFWSLFTVFLSPSKWSTSSLDVIFCKFASFHWSLDDKDDSTDFANAELDLAVLKSLIWEISVIQCLLTLSWPQSGAGSRIQSTSMPLISTVESNSLWTPISIFRV